MGRGACRVQEPPLLGAAQGNQVALARRGSCGAAGLRSQATG